MSLIKHVKLFDFVMSLRRYASYGSYKFVVIRFGYPPM